MTSFYFGSNFKMHQTPQQTEQYVAALRQLIPADLAAQFFLIPPFTSLPAASTSLTNSGIWLGAQNMHWANEGAYTGEISATMLRSLDVDLIMLGHAERREHFGETDESLRKKVATAAEHGLRILLCVGENADQRQSGNAQETITRQLKIALADFPASSLSRLMIAYEPVWSIGEGGSPADAATVATMHDGIRAISISQFGTAGRSIPILYGGSVNPTNCASYAALPQVDGLFVGRAAWTPASFVDVLNRALDSRPKSSTKS